MSTIIVYGIISLVFAFMEYIQHSEYHKKHPDYDHCGSGIIGFVILGIALIIHGFTMG